MERRSLGPEEITGLLKIAEYGLLVIGILKLSRLAFSWQVRQEILQRDEYECVECGATQNLEAAHYDHNKSNSYYDDPDNGRTLCTECHLKDHQRRVNNGLSTKHNRWAIQQLKKKISQRKKEIVQLQLL